MVAGKRYEFRERWFESLNPAKSHAPVVASPGDRILNSPVVRCPECVSSEVRLRILTLVVTLFGDPGHIESIVVGQGVNIHSLLSCERWRGVALGLRLGFRGTGAVSGVAGF